VTISSAIKKAQASRAKYLTRTLPNGRESLLQIMHDGSIGSCYPNGDSYCEHHFDVSELIASNWQISFGVETE
jgi:hypothetical protein